MAYWLCVYYPSLSWEMAFPESSPGAALAVLEGGRILACSPGARVVGVRVGDSGPGAALRTPLLQLRPRHVAREDAWLSEQAQVALTWTSQVREEGHALLLEIGASERLFRGRQALVRQVRAALGGRLQTVCAGAPTPVAAWWLARTGRSPLATEPLRGVLAPLPVSALSLPSAEHEGLSALGVRTGADVWRLPRTGVRTRFPVLQDLLERALTGQPDPAVCVAPAPCFQESHECPWPLETVSALLPGVVTLQERLARALSSRCVEALALRLDLGHARRSPSTLALTLARPDLALMAITRLWQERMAAFRLPAPVISLRLSALEVSPMAGSGMLDLFGIGRAGHGPDLPVLLEARLGGRVRGVVRADSHCPENAWDYARPGASGQIAVRAVRGERPVWFLRSPRRLRAERARPCLGGCRLRLEAGPERIESGWWEGVPVVRDYFIARDAGARRFWVFRARDRKTWFLQGVFA